MGKYRVAIVEDDPLSQQMLQDILRIDIAHCEVHCVFGGVEEALAVLKNTDIDLLLLDMELPDGRGFDVLSGLDEINFEVIITTMHDSYMLDAIKHSAIDYLMKPITTTALREAVGRFEQRIQKQKLRSESAGSGLPRINKLAIAHQTGLILADLRDIIRLESDGAYTKIFMHSGSMHYTSKNLKHYEEKLAGQLFFRVHHGALINLLHVRNYVKGEGGHVVMSDGSTVDVSRRRKEQFLLQLGI